MTGIPVLRGLADETANLPDLGKAIANLTSGGNYDLQQKLKQAIASDPSIAESLGQLAKDNPQLFGSLKLGKLGDQIAQTPPGYKQKSEDLALQRGTADLAETKARTTNYENENTEAPIRQSLLNYQLGAAKRGETQAQEAAKGFPDINFKKAVDDYTKGVQSPDVLKALSNQTAMKLFSDMLGYKKMGEQIQASADRQDKSLEASFTRMALREDKKQKDAQISEGKAFALKTGVGTPETWAAYLNNPDIQAQADLLLKNGIPPDHAHDQNLFNLRNIAQRRNQDQEIHIASITRPNNIQIETTLRDMKAGKIDKSFGLEKVNNLLRTNANEAGTRHIMMVTGDNVPGVGGIRGWIDNHKIVAIDAQTGQRLTDIQDADGHLSDNITGSLDKYTSQAPTSPFTQKEVEENRAGIYKASDKDISDLQAANPAMYQILLPDIQKREMAMRLSKGSGNSFQNK